MDRSNILIANAGMSNTSPSLFNTPVSEIQKCIDVNAYEPPELVRATMPSLRAARQYPLLPSLSTADVLIPARETRQVLLHRQRRPHMDSIVPLPSYNAGKAKAIFLVK